MKLHINQLRKSNGKGTKKLLIMTPHLWIHTSQNHHQKFPAGHLQTGKMELGLCIPYKPNKVANLKKFKYDNPTGRFVQQQVRKVPVIRGNSLVFIIETIVTEDGIQDPLSITSTGTSFTTAIEQDLKNLYRQNQEKDVRIKESEEQLNHTKKDEDSLGECKSCLKRSK
jgi:hypothetical protein